MKKTECVAMLLAGGQGSRLGVLTQKIAKPAVPYGGKYRIIDFPLSNCANSGITTVGILTQYQPLELSDYVASGKFWDLDRRNGGVHVLPPYQQISGANWYRGTANAIYQKLNFIERYNPEYVLILSGDHIYKMDYAKMIAQHKEQNADCTISVIDVPLEEASRFGIINCNPDGTIYEFEEKPKQPKSTLASMGIYVFKWEQLRKYLIADEEKEGSSNDFGKDVLPAMLSDGCKMMVYRFDDYWKDVGTIESLWDANLDLLNPKIDLNLSDPNWKIYSGTQGLPPQYVGDSAEVENSLVTVGCDIGGKLDFSVLFENVTVEEGAVVEYSLVMPGSVIKKGAALRYAIVAENAVIEEGAVIGQSPEEIANIDDWGIAVIGDGLTVKKNAVVTAGKMITKDVEEGETI